MRLLFIRGGKRLLTQALHHVIPSENGTYATEKSLSTTHFIIIKPSLTQHPAIQLRNSDNNKILPQALGRAKRVSIGFAMYGKCLYLLSYYDTFA